MLFFFESKIKPWSRFTLGSTFSLRLLWIFSPSPTPPLVLGVSLGIGPRGTGEVRGGVKCRGRGGFKGSGEFRVRDRGGFRVGVDLG